LNPWAAYDDVTAAIEDGAVWLWGPTTTPDGAIGWDLPLPRMWPRLAAWLAERRPPVVLATGHLGAEGRRAFAETASAAGLACSITHTLFVPLEEALGLADRGCAFEIDAYTYTTTIADRRRRDLIATVEELARARALVYLTSDGGQAATGDPFAFGSRFVGLVADAFGADTVRELAIDGPRAMVAAVSGARG
jgi:hypothetical protein